jgi:RNA polymerase sigma-70 factor (ECF subfamily)
MLTTSHSYTEQELVDLLLQKNQQAFAYLYDNYSGALMGIIARMIPDHSLAEDVLQEAFVKIWNNFASYSSSKGRLFTWMVNLTRNLAIDTLRSRSFKNQQKIAADETAANTLPEETSAINRYDASLLRKQVDTLKTEHQQIIDLAYFNGFTQEQIATQLQLPLGTVKTRMRSAILALRKQY